jgi:carotenoid cleavage dioxygenase-like enzyme
VFFHDFLVTERYYVFTRSPISFNPLSFLLGTKVSNFLVSMTGRPTAAFRSPASYVCMQALNHTFGEFCFYLDVLAVLR